MEEVSLKDKKTLEFVKIEEIKFKEMQVVVLGLYNITLKG